MAKRPPKPTDRESAPRHRKRAKSAKEQSPAPKPRSLAALFRSEAADPDELKKSLNERFGSSDRTTCIVFSAGIERELEDLILRHLHIEHEELGNLLFERDGALSTFYGNIRFGRALGLYDKSFQAILDTIRRIRNAFAHSAIPITFASDEIKSELHKLPKFLQETEGIEFGKITEERRHFLTCCLVIHTRFGQIRDRRIKELERNTVAMEFYLEHLRQQRD